MRCILFLCLVMATVYGAKARNLNKPDSLAIYNGRYQMTINGKTGYIQIDDKNDQLTLTAIWTGEKNTLKHLNGDNFIMLLKGWAVKFNRDKKGNVVSVLVMGHDLWTKVKGSF